jgi:hypothetical protein
LHGTVIGKDSEPDFALFIPDKGCPVAQGQQTLEYAWPHAQISMSAANITPRHDEKRLGIAGRFSWHGGAMSVLGQSHHRRG